MSELLRQQLDRSALTEQIAERLYTALDGHDSVLVWTDAPPSTREWYRARARQALRSCIDFAALAAVGQAARALASCDGYDHVAYTAADAASIARRQRYIQKAQAAWSAIQWHLAESAYPDDVERQMARNMVPPKGRTLGELVDETRRSMWVVPATKWREESAQEVE